MSESNEDSEKKATKRTALWSDLTTANVDSPHARPNCGVHNFADDKFKFCEKCSCIPCDKPASECTQWAQHCHVSSTSGTAISRSDREREMRRKNERTAMDISRADRERISMSGREREMRREKERFLMFTRVLMKYLESKDPPLHQKVKAIIKDCAERNRRQEPGYESVTASMKERLKQVVGEQYWKRAEAYLGHFLTQKQKAQQEAQQKLAASGQRFLSSNRASRAAAVADEDEETAEEDDKAEEAAEEWDLICIAEEWELIYIIPKTDRSNIDCDQSGCTKKACSGWATTKNPQAFWYGCKTCTEEEFGGAGCWEGEGTDPPSDDEEEDDGESVSSDAAVAPEESSQDTKRTTVATAAVDSAGATDDDDDDDDDGDERSPSKRLKSMAPDVTVVVGGRKFRHYKVLLCMGCSFFDTMLSTSNAMKESQENRIEFPDKDPDEWEVVYKFLDPTVSDAEKDTIFQNALRKDEDGKLKPTRVLALRYLTWFDYLGMETLLQKYDKMLANDIKDQTISFVPCPEYARWSKNKHLPFPAFQKIRKQQIKHCFLCVIHKLSRQKREEKYRSRVNRMKKYLLDDEVGDELWQFLLGHLDFPDNMLQDNDKATIVSSPLFIDLLEMLGKDLECPKRLKEFCKSDT